jgi:hypothetical protein
MATLAEIEREIARIKERNARVEADKEWETSLARKVLLFALTYIVALSFFLLANLPNPYANALIPAIAYLLSTLTLSYFKGIWLMKRSKK